ncbi:MAG: 30S ribosomal protein S6e [Nanoarchaeota archaeon]|nr:30S ribosomal protein S6e [Nanoarchaeota archaeon]
MKIVMSDPKTGKSYQKELDKSVEAQFYGKKIGETFNGELIDLQGYQFQITGGSDKSGFPMRAEIKGSVRKRILLTKGIGMQSNVKGLRKKKSVRGHTISDVTAQINTKIVKMGSAKLDELFKKEEGEKK